MEKNNRQILICRGTGCESSKSPEIQKPLLKSSLEGTDVEVKFTGCHGMCQQGPIVIVEPEDMFYAKVKTRDVAKIVDQHINEGQDRRPACISGPNKQRKASPLIMTSLSIPAKNDWCFGTAAKSIQKILRIPWQLESIKDLKKPLICHRK